MVATRRRLEALMLLVLIAGERMCVSAGLLQEAGQKIRQLQGQATRDVQSFRDEVRSLGEKMAEETHPLKSYLCAGLPAQIRIPSGFHETLRRAKETVKTHSAPITRAYVKSQTRAQLPTLRASDLNRQVADLGRRVHNYLYKVSDHASKLPKSIQGEVRAHTKVWAKKIEQEMHHVVTGGDVLHVDRLRTLVRQCDPTAKGSAPRRMLRELDPNNKHGALFKWMENRRNMVTRAMCDFDPSAPDSNAGKALRRAAAEAGEAWNRNAEAGKKAWLREVTVPLSEMCDAVGRSWNALDDDEKIMLVAAVAFVAWLGYAYVVTPGSGVGTVSFGIQVDKAILPLVKWTAQGGWKFVLGASVLASVGIHEARVSVEQHKRNKKPGSSPQASPSPSSSPTPSPTPTNEPTPEAHEHGESDSKSANTCDHSETPSPHSEGGSKSHFPPNGPLDFDGDNGDPLGTRREELPRSPEYPLLDPSSASARTTLFEVGPFSGFVSMSPHQGIQGGFTVREEDGREAFFGFEVAKSNVLTKGFKVEVFHGAEVELNVPGESRSGELDSLSSSLFEAPFQLNNGVVAVVARTEISGGADNTITMTNHYEFHADSTTVGSAMVVLSGVAAARIVTLEVAKVLAEVGARVGAAAVVSGH